MNWTSVLGHTLDMSCTWTGRTPRTLVRVSCPVTSKDWTRVRQVDVKTGPKARLDARPAIGAWQPSTAVDRRLFKARRDDENAKESREVEAIGAQCATGRAIVDSNHCARRATVGAWSLDTEVTA